jgi:hypothetical protein
VKKIFFGQLSARACIPPGFSRDQQKAKKKPFYVLCALSNFSGRFSPIEMFAKDS